MSKDKVSRLGNVHWNVTMRLDPELKMALQNCIRSNGRIQSSLILSLLKDWVEGVDYNLPPLVLGRDRWHVTLTLSPELKAKIRESVRSKGIEQGWLIVSLLKRWYCQVGGEDNA